MKLEYIKHMGNTDIRLFVVTVFKRQTHFHSDIEIIMPLEGSVSIDIESRRSRINVGEFFIINRNEAHSLVSSSGQNMLLVLQFNPNFARDYYPQLARIRILQRHITRESSPRLHAALSACFYDMLRCICEPESENEAYPLQLMASLSIAAASIIRCGVCASSTDLINSAEEKSRVRLLAIIDYIQENYIHNISLADLAKKENLSVTYLSHFIKDNLGISFREYINRLRFERAVYLVTKTRLRIIDICVECGYSDYRYLNKAFLKEFGKTPSQIRESAGVFELSSQAQMAGMRIDSDEEDFVNLASVYRHALRKLEADESVRGMSLLYRGEQINL